MITYNLTRKVQLYFGAAGGDLFNATADTLLTGDIIAGGAGTNTLALNGAGTFNLAAFWQIKNIQIVTAQEGQPAYTSGNGAIALPGTRQTLYLRNGLDVTVNVASATIDPGNPTAAGITIYGAHNADIINLGTGNDTVQLGDARESVYGGGGNDTFIVDAATIGATLDGGSGNTTLQVTGGGAVTMGSSITRIAAVQLEDAPAGSIQSAYTFVATGLANLSITASSGNDTITLGAASQSVTAGAGADAVIVTAATAGALVNGAANTTLQIQGGGSATLNRATDHVIVQMLQAGSVVLSGGTHVSAIGSTGANTVTAMATGQTITSVSGQDTLIGYQGGEDTFTGTASGLSGDTIKNFSAPSDRIDITNIANSAATLAYNGTLTGGTLIVSDGTKSADIVLAGLFKPAGFHVAGDGGTGSLITYRTPTSQLTLAAGLLNDTGVSPTDGITSDPAVVGTVTASSAITALTASLDGGLATSVLPDIASSGTFQLTDAIIAAIAGGAIADGAHTLTLTAGDATGDHGSTSVAFTLRTALPALTVALADDTGLPSHPGLTSDDAISGTVTDPAGIAALTVSVDGGPAGNALPDVSLGGALAISASALNALAGSQLADGQHTVSLQATDVAGNVSHTSVSFTLQTATPTLTFSLAAADQSTAGQLQTTGADVTLIGQTGAGDTVTLISNGETTIADTTGTFRFTNVQLAVGNNAITIHSTDPAGNTGSLTETISRTTPTTATTDPVLLWNKTLLSAIALDADAPTVASRSLAMESLAVYDAIAAIDGTPGYLVNLEAASDASPTAAVDEAADQMLDYLYPAQTATFDAQLATELAALPDDQSEADGVTLGKQSAAAIIALRVNDGSTVPVTDYGSDAVGQWQPTAPGFLSAITPQWANVTPFALTSPDQFLPAAPPSLTSAAYAAAVNETESLGASNSTTRTAAETQLALFWNDQTGTYTPAGEWNTIATSVAQSQNDSMATDAQMLAELNVAEADAGIAAWNTKFTYNAWRPITAIQNANEIGNSAITQDATWTPLLITPAFPEYAAGHAVFSSAAAQVLDSFFGADTGFTASSPSLAGVTLTYSSFDQAAQAAGESRVYGGIHFQFSVDAGLTLGQQVGNWTLAVFNNSQDTVPPKIILDQTSGLVTKTDPTITGDVTDNLSGVASMTVSLDGGAATNVTFDAEGNFSVPVTLPTNGTADGQHVLAFIATDAAANVTTPVDFDFTLATSPPTIGLASGSIKDGGTLASGAMLIGTAVAETGATLAGLSYSIDGAVPMPLAFGATTGAFDQAITLGNLAAGSHTLVVTATDNAGNVTTDTLHLTEPALPALTITSLTPTAGADDVGVTFRPEVTFSRAVDPATLTSSSFYATDTTGQVIPANVVPVNDNAGAYLFFTNPLPSASTITLHVNGSLIRAAADGAELDAAASGSAGSSLTESFVTVNTTPVPNTTISGIVVDPGPDLTPMSPDDVKAGPDGLSDFAEDTWKLPIAGVEVFVVGDEQDAVYTDANGNFTLKNVPAGDVKVEFNGLTATNAPSGFYFPTMVMDLNVKPGSANTVMGDMGSPSEQTANAADPAVYLPRLEDAVLQTVSSATSATLHLVAGAAPQLTPAQQSELSVTVPAGSFLDANGNPLSSAQIGVSTVPVSLIQAMLPAGTSGVTVALTLQAPAVAKFTAPLQATFPNSYGAAPGTQLNVFSYDHATGKITVDGTATVSADGKTVVTDPGSGIKFPGWFYVTPPGDCGSSGGAPPSDSPPPPMPDDTTQTLDTVVEPMIFGDDPGTFSLSWTAPDALPDTPPPPPANNSNCPPPQRPADPPNQHQPYVRVTIAIDGPLSDFMQQTGDLPLEDQTFQLDAGSGETKTFELSAQTIDQMFPDGLGSVPDDVLYGSEIKITEVDGNSDGSTSTTISTYDLYRFINATAPVDDETDDTVDMGPVMDDDEVDQEQDITLMTGDATTPSSVDVTDDSYGSFTATVVGKTLKLTVKTNSKGTAQATLKVTNANGKPVPGTIITKVKGVTDKIFVNLNSGANSLEAILKAIPKTNANYKLITGKSLGALEKLILADMSNVYSAFGIKVVTTASPLSATSATVDYGASSDSLWGNSSGGGASGGLSNAPAIGAVLDKIAADQAANKLDTQASVTSLANALSTVQAASTVLVYAGYILSNVTFKNLTTMANFIANVGDHEVGHTLNMPHNSVLPDIMIAGPLNPISNRLNLNRFLVGQSYEPMLLASGNQFSLTQGLAALSYYQRNRANLGADISPEGTQVINVPAVTGLVASGGFSTGQVMAITMTLSEGVILGQASNTPYLELSDGATATYDATASNLTIGSLVFDDKIAAGDSTSDLSVLGVDTNGLTITAADGTLADFSGASDYDLGVAINQAVITAISAPAGTTSLTPGQQTQLTVTMNQAVTVNTAGGIPVLSLSNGATAQLDIAASTPAAGKLVFDYVTGPNDYTTDLVVNGVTLNGATIRDPNGSPAELSFANGYDLALDVDAATVTGVTATPGTGEAAAGQVVTLKVTLNEAVTVNTAAGDPTLTLDDGGTATYDAAKSNPAAGSLVFDYTVASSDRSAKLTATAVNLAGATITDKAGNAADLSGVASFPTTLQVGPISVAQVTPSADANLATGQMVQVLVRLTGPVSVKTAAGSPVLTMNDGGVATYDAAASTASSGTLVFDYTVSSGDYTTDLQVGSYSANNATVLDSNGVAADFTAVSGYDLGPDVNAATVTAVAVTPGTGEVQAGQTIAVSLTMSSAVTVDTAAGTPTLSLNDGGTASYDAASSKPSAGLLVFDSTVLGTDRTNRLQVAGINLNGATVLDAAGRPADLSAAANFGTSLQIGSAYISQITPSVTAGVTGQTFQITVALTEGVTVDTTAGAPTLVLSDGDIASYDAAASNPLAGSLVFHVTPSATAYAVGLSVSALDLNGAAVRDANAVAADLSGATGADLGIDVNATVVTGLAATPGTGAITAGQTAVLTLSLSGPVTVDTSSGSPILDLNDGGTAVYEAAGSKPSAGKLVFDAVVTAGDATPALLASDLDLNGAQITDPNGDAVDFAALANFPTGLQVGAATVTQVSANKTGAVTTGQIVQIGVVLSTGLTLDTSGGSPTLALSDSATAVYDASASDLAAGVLIFDYTVGSADYAVNPTVLALQLNGAIAKDLNGSAADFSGAAGQTLALDVNAPVVSGVAATPASGEIDPGQQGQITLAMNQAVVVTTAGGSPTLTLNDGGTASYDAAASTPASGSLVFDFTVGSSDRAEDLQVSQVNLNGATVTGISGNAADFSAASTFTTELQVAQATGSLSVVDDKTGSPTGSQYSLGTVLLDQTGQATLDLQNSGTGNLIIDSAQIVTATSVITVGAIAAGTVIAPGASVQVPVTFVPTSAGSATAQLVISSNDPNGPTQIDLLGTGQSPTPFAAVTRTASNNLGGAATATATGSVSRDGIFTITNNGAQPLIISGITLGDIGDFSLTGVPSDLTSDPITLAFGQTFSFGATFHPVNPGLDQGVIKIASNDPANPVIQVDVVGTGLSSADPVHWGNDYVALNDGTGPITQLSDSSGNFSYFIGADTPYTLSVFDPVSGLIAANTATSGASGQSLDLTRDLVFAASQAPDTDYDGLPDDIENTIGTNPNIADSVVPGLSDGAALQDGLIGSGTLATQTGVVSTLALQGTAEALAIAGSTTNSAALTAYIATGNYGLAIVDVSNFRAPVLLGQLQIANANAEDVAVDSALQIAAVAANSGGLALVNVADPTAPVLLETVAIDASHVAVSDGIAYAAVGGTIDAIDMTTGLIVQQIAVNGSGGIDSLAIDGDSLYALTNGGYSSHTVTKYTIGSQLAYDTALTVTGHPTFGRMYMTVGGGYIYVGAADNNDQQEIPGVEILQDTGSSLQLVGPPSGITAFDVAVNGSGLALFFGAAAAGPQSSGDLLGVLNVSNPTNTGDLLQTISLGGNGEPYTMQVAAGEAFIADGTAGLKVVNYQGVDTTGIPPVISNVTGPADVDPNTPGIQVVEGSVVTLSATVTDNVQVRNVEVLVDGTVVSNSVTYPWNLSAVMPTIANNGTAPITLQIEAVDTGGNTTITAPISVQVVKDTIPPVLLDEDVTQGGTRGQTFRSFTFDFSKPLDPATAIAANFELIGPDGNPVAAQSIELRNNNKTVEVTFPTLALGSNELILNAAAITDTSGNALGSAPLTTSFMVQAYSTQWTNQAGGDWNVAANWSSGTVPASTDDVLFGSLPGIGYDVSIPYATTAIANALTLNDGNAVITDSGTLTVGGTIDAVAGTFIVAGYITGGATILATGGTIQVQSGTIGAVTIDAPLNLANYQSLHIGAGAVFNDSTGLLPGTINLNGYDDEIYADGSPTLNHATINLGSNAGYYDYLYAGVTGAGTLTLGPDLTLNALGSVEYLSQYYGGSAIVNQGTIDAAYSNGSFYISPSSFTNSGTIAVSGGENLYIQSSGFTNTAAGSISVGTGSALHLSATITAASLDGISNDGGKISIDGTFLNAGTTLAVGTDSALGALGLSGTILGGTVQDLGGGIVSANGTLSGVTYEGALTVAAGASLHITNGTTFEGPGGSGPGTIDLAGAGSALYVDASTSFANTDVILGAGALLHLAGTLTPAQLTAIVQGITNQGGTVALDGLLLNSGHTLALGVGGLGALALAGTIAGGAISDPSGALFGAGGTLSGVSDQGMLDLNNGASLHINNGTTFDGPNGAGPGTISLAGYSSYLYADGNQTIDNATINLGAAGSYYDYLYASSTGSGTLTLGAGLTVKAAGSYGFITQYYTDTIINDGLIEGAVSGGVLYVSPATLINAGTIEASNGQDVYLQASSFTNTAAGRLLFSTGANAYITSNGTNAGIISLASSATLHLTGNVTASQLQGVSNTGGIISIDGIFNNAGSTLAVGTATEIGAIALPGILAGGVVRDDGTGLLGTGGTLSAVTYEGTLDLEQANASLWLANGTTFDGADGTGPGTINLTGAGANLYIASSETLGNVNLTLGHGATLHLTGSVTAANLTALLAAVTNTGGTVSIDGDFNNAGQTLAVGPATAVGIVSLAGTIAGGVVRDSGGGLTQAGGTLSAVTYEGTLDFSGSNPSLSIANGTVFEGPAGSGPGTVNMTGTNSYLYIDGSQTLDNATIDLGGTLGYYNYIYAGAQGSGTLTLGPKLTLNDLGGNVYLTQYYGAATIINDGTIIVAGSSGTFYIDPSIFTNAGTISVSGGAALYLAPASFTNTAAGHISVADGSVLHLSGVVPTAQLNHVSNNGGAIEIDGTLVNTGATLAIGAGSPLGGLVLAGTIEGGVIQDSGSGLSSTYGSLSGVTYEGPLRIANSTLHLAGNTTFEGRGGTGPGAIDLASGAQLYVDSSETLGATAITLEAGAVLHLSGSLTAAALDTTLANAVNKGGEVELDGTFINTGSTLALGTGTGLGTLTLTGTIVGGVVTDNGTGLRPNGGTLDAVTYKGVLDLGTNGSNLHIANGTSLLSANGSGPGTIELSGYYDYLYFDGSGTIDNVVIEIDGPTGYYNYIYAGGNGGNETLTLGASTTVNVASGSAYLSQYYGGATIVSDGTINVTSGGILTIEPGSFINAGTIAVGSGDTLYIETSGFTNTPTGRINVAAGGAVHLGGTVTAALLKQLSNSSGTLSIDGLFINTGSTLAIGTGSALGQLGLAGTIQGGVLRDSGDGLTADGGTLSAVTYQGALNLTAANASLHLINGASFEGAGGTGPGTINVTGANSSLYLGAGEVLINTGITLGPAAELHVAGALSPAQLSGVLVNVVNNGGTIAIDGTFNNAGHTLDVGSGASLGAVALYGTLAGGVVRDSGGGLIGQEGTLSNVTYEGTLDFTTFYTGLSIANGITFTGAEGTGRGTIELNGYGNYLTFDGNETLDNATVNIGGASGYDDIYAGGDGAATLTLGPNLTLNSSGGTAYLSQYYGASAIVNDGTISLNGKTGALYISTAAFTNAGTILVSGGEALYFESTTFASAPGGEIVVRSSSSVYFSNTVTAAELASVTNHGGTIGIGGVFINAGTTLAIGAGSTVGTLGLSGTLVGGTVRDGGLGLAGNYGTLSGVTYEGPLVLAQQNAALYIANGTEFKGAGGSGPGAIILTGTNAALYINPGETLVNTGVTLNATTSLQLQGAITPTQLTDALANVDNNGGAIVIAGTLINAGNTLQVGAGSALRQISVAGTIEGGVVRDTGRGVISDGGELSGVTYQGTLDLSGTAYSYLTIANGTTFEGAGGSGRGTIDLTGANSSLAFAAGQALDDAVINIGGSAGFSYDVVQVAASGGNAAPGLGSNLTINVTGPDGYLENSYYGGAGPIISAATINAAAANGSLNIGGTAFVNAGVIALASGNTVAIESTSFTNAATGRITIGTGATLSIADAGFTDTGSITLDAGGVLALGGTLTTAALQSIIAEITDRGGTIELDGTLINTGSILAVGAGTAIGAIALRGMVAGGVVANSGSGLQAEGGDLSGVTYEGTLDLSQAGSYLTIDDGTKLEGTGGVGPGSVTLTGLGSTLRTDGVGPLAGAAITLGPSASLHLGGTFTTGAFTTLLGQVSDAGGLISLDGTLLNAGGTLAVGPGSRAGNLDLTGTILGGVVKDSGGGLLGIYGELDGVTFEGTLDLENYGADLSLAGGTTLQGLNGTSPLAVNLTGGDTVLDLLDSNTTLNNGTIAIGSAFGDTLYAANGTTQTVTLGAKLTVTTVGSLAALEQSSFYAQATIVNDGTINAIAPDGELTVDAGRFLNDGTVTASNGGTVTFAASLIEVSGSNSVGGSGVFDVGGNASIIFAANLDSGTTMNFIGGGGTIELNQSGIFAETINGFSQLATLDLRGLMFGPTDKLTASNAATTTLVTVTDGQNQAELTFAGAVGAAMFKTTNDGFGGILLTHS